MNEIKKQTSYSSILGTIIRYERQSRGLNRKDFAELIGLSLSSCARIELGEVSITLDNLRKIALHFDLSVQTLLDKVDEVKIDLEKQNFIIIENILPKEQDFLQSNISTMAMNYSVSSAAVVAALGMSGGALPIPLIGSVIGSVVACCVSNVGSILSNESDNIDEDKKD
ncbi:helix-turn-helix domain-containing protein [Photobacterium damselae]|uniref:helix-turn-helix domain-containing protein n=1 Tax=Photobacterium damselae TaxID=38293 RepID=UPI0030F3CCDA